MNRTFPTQEIGSLKKPSWCLEILRDRRRSPEEKSEVRNDLALLNITTMERIGLDLVYDGEARRVEMYEYPIKNIGGFRFCGRVRSWDNKYYRKARCVDRVSYLGNYHGEEFEFVQRNAVGEVKVPVTGPYTLAEWSYNEHYSSREDFVMDLSKEIVRPLLHDLVRMGAKNIQLDEPAATTHPREIELFAEAINEACRGIDAKIGLHVCYSGDGYRSLLKISPRIRVQQLVLEFANRDGWEPGRDFRVGYEPLQQLLGNGYEGEIGVGVVDVHRDEVEPPELIRDRILHAAKIIGDPSRIFVNPDCGLRTRSRKVSFAKLASMVKGTRMARESVR